MTGEHRIGVEKLSAVEAELPGRLRELQRAVKAAFDPQGILNPGTKLWCSALQLSFCLW